MACVRACDVGSSRCIVLVGVTPGISCTECEAAAPEHPKVVLVAGFKCSACPKHKWLTICLVLGAILVVAGYLVYTIKKKQRAEAPKLRSASTSGFRLSGLQLYNYMCCLLGPSISRLSRRPSSRMPSP
jgi:hypothetical protein